MFENMSSTVVYLELFLILQLLLMKRINGIDCSKWANQNPCNLDSNGGCSWIDAGCRCASSINKDYWMIFDHSNNVSSSETSMGKTWLEKIINAGVTQNSQIGFSIQLKSNASYAETEYIAKKSWSDHINFVETSINGDGTGIYNRFVYAMLDMVFRYSSSSNERIAIMLATDIPCGTVQGGNPSGDCLPSDIDLECSTVCSLTDTSICDQASNIFNANIRLIVIYSNYMNNYDYGCITQNASTDFIYLNTSSINAYSTLDSITPKLLDIMCPLPSYTITITEIKTATSSLNIYQEYDAPFVEIYNSYSSPINLKQLVFEGLITGTLTTGSTSRILPAQYLVIYNADIGNVSCIECNCTKTNAILCDNAVYLPCGASYNCIFHTSMHSANWYITIKDTHETEEKIIADLTYSNPTFPSNIDDFSVELDDSTWTMSCNYQGSPGSLPLSTCSTNNPSGSPSKSPTNIPSSPPTEATISPSLTPTDSTISPSKTPSMSPSNNPSIVPTNNPSINPSTYNPTYNPSISPSEITDGPTYSPSFRPTKLPTLLPTDIPTDNPSYPPNYIEIDASSTSTTEGALGGVPTGDEVTEKPIDDRQSAGSNEKEDEFKEKWIWVIIIGIIFIVVLMFFIFICRWRSAIIKQTNSNTQRRTKDLVQPQAVMIASTPYSEDRRFNDDEQDSTDGNKRRFTDKTDQSDGDVIQTMITSGNGTGGDSMYGIFNATPMGVPADSAEIEDDDQNNDVNDGNNTKINSNAMSDNYDRYESEDLYRTGTELANLAKANAFKGGNPGNLPPQPEVITAGGFESTADGPQAAKIGEKSIAPEILEKWNSNTDESSSSDDNNHMLYGKKTRNTPFGDIGNNDNVKIKQPVINKRDTLGGDDNNPNIGNDEFVIQNIND